MPSARWKSPVRIFANGILELSAWMPAAILIAYGLGGHGLLWAWLCVYPFLFIGASATSPLWKTGGGILLLIVLLAGGGYAVFAVGGGTANLGLCLLAGVFVVRGAWSTGGRLSALAIGTLCSLTSLPFSRMLPSPELWSWLLQLYGILFAAAVLVSANHELLMQSAYYRNILASSTLRYARQVLTAFAGIVLVIALAAFPWYAGIRFHPYKGGLPPDQPVRMEPPSAPPIPPWLEKLRPAPVKAGPSEDPLWYRMLMAAFAWAAHHWILLVVFAALLLVLVLWKPVAAMLRKMAAHLRGWGSEEEQELPYVDESRSLRGKKSAKPREPGGQRASAREGREEWEALTPEQRVRRLYRSLLRQAVKEGFPLKESRTPAKVWEELGAWALAGGREALLSRMRQAEQIPLMAAYLKARYGNKRLTEEEAGKVGRFGPG